MIRRFLSRYGLCALGLAVLGASLFGQTASAIDRMDTVINYHDSSDLTDPAKQLNDRLGSRNASLAYESNRGYLKSVLRELHIPLSSQTLVFSKTSEQAAQTGPKTPRAIYFGDNVYVGWVQGGPTIDIVSIDPRKGAIFYTLAQRQAAKPRLERQESCFPCHAEAPTLGVPGPLVRSVFTLKDGTAHSGVLGFVSGHNNPLKERWGGWYVTGTHGADVHLGNSTLSREQTTAETMRRNSNLTSLKGRFDTSKYLSPASDAVALIVLDHMVRVQNLITRARYETLYAQNDRKTDPAMAEYATSRIARAVDSLLMDILFRNEAPLDGPIRGTTAFAKEFVLKGPRDRRGRSLREFDLKRRVFRYPCSYLIYSPGFDGIPDEAKLRTWARLDEILAGKDATGFFNMAPTDRKAVREILLDTKPDFRAWCEAHPRP